MSENKKQLSALDKIDEILLRCDYIQKRISRADVIFIPEYTSFNAYQQLSPQNRQNYEAEFFNDWMEPSRIEDAQGPFNSPTGKIFSYEIKVFSVEFEYLLNLAESLEFIESLTSKTNGAIQKFQLKPEGYKRINELLKSVDSTQTFIAMSFSADLNSLAEAISEVVKDCGYTPCHLGLPPHSLHNENICNKIIGEIKRSKFVIADFTLDRPNVYWEAGFAKGLGREVIHTVREDWKDKIAFDIKQTKFIEWPSLEELKRQLKEYIQATVD